MSERDTFQQSIAPTLIKSILHQHSLKVFYIQENKYYIKVPKILLKSVSLTKDYSLAIIPRFLNLLVVPKNNINSVVFFQTHSKVFLELEDDLFHY